MPTIPCPKRLIKDKNIIVNPKKTLGSLSGDFILVKRKETNIKRKGIKTEPMPKYSDKNKLYRVVIGLVCRKEKIDKKERIRKKMAKID